jgi:hypothetical protein
MTNNKEGRTTMRKTMLVAFAVAATVGLAGAALSQGQTQTATKTKGYVGQMSEEQIRQKLQGEGFSEVTEIKKIPITSYQWTAKAVRNGKPMDITISELGHVSAK